MNYHDPTFDDDRTAPPTTTPTAVNLGRRIWRALRRTWSDMTYLTERLLCA
jgi:hypothetical protein